jgi:aspartate kinase
MAGGDSYEFGVRGGQDHDISPERITAELDKKRIVIVAGFQGINKYDDITTLGGRPPTPRRGAGAALRADKCQIYTDVNGVYTRTRGS